MCGRRCPSRSEVLPPGTIQARWIRPTAPSLEADGHSRGVRVMTSFGERLASVRKRRGLTQRELASESGVSVSLIRQLEQGHLTATRADTARKLAVAMRVLTT